MPTTGRASPHGGAHEPEQTIPVVREDAEIRKREVEKGRVVVRTRVREREELLRESLRHDEVELERVALNREVDGPLEVRHEGDCTVIPVLEEVLVVQKRWVLKEEIRIRRRSVERPHEERVRLRSEEATVEREAAAGEKQPEKNRNPE